MSEGKLEASFSTLVLSIGSSAAMALGMAPDPNSGKVNKDLDMAKLNIDLLLLLQDKTKNNLLPEETQLLSRILADLQLRFVEESRSGGKK
jgi:hypothetical protein